MSILTDRARNTVIKGKLDTVIFDIDGTLADVDHRRHFVIGKKKDFDAFYDAMVDDTVKVAIQELNHMCKRCNHKIIICTGRPEKYRSITVEWLRDNCVYFDELHMRPDEMRFKPDFEIKQNMLNGINDKHNVIFAVDDRNQVVDMWRSNGVTCLQVADGDF